MKVIISLIAESLLIPVFRIHKIDFQGFLQGNNFLIVKLASLGKKLKRLAGQ